MASVVSYYICKWLDRDDSDSSPKVVEEIYSELADSRGSYGRGEYEDFDEDFDDALDNISERYGL